MANWSGRTVLVTGAGGFIASHLVERLVHDGARVRAFVRYNSMGRRGFLDDFAPETLRSIEVVAATVEDPFAVRKAVAGCDTVFHLAALIGIPYSYVAPQHYVTTNVAGSVNVFEAAVREGVRRVVHTSTSETYGTAQYTPIDERHPLVGQSPYSASKIAADQMAIAWHRSFALPVAILRPFNTFGPRQSARAIVPTIMAQLLAGLPEVRVGNLEPRRDLNFVADTVAGFVGIADCDAAVGEVVHVGSGETRSVGEIIERVFAVAGRSLPVVSEAERVRPAASEVGLLLADNRKAAQLFGYAPRHTFDDGLRQVWSYMERHRDRYRADLYNI
jgi:UDP-glucose 4-epimerase